jgi:lysophospholipase L1-like esterase
MNRLQAFLIAMAVAFPVLVSAPTLAAQQADPDPARFADAIDRFSASDQQNTAPTGAVLFVGSSTIRGWDTAARFPGTTVLNRGFGGSHISDVNHYIGETVLRYRPRVVVFYAGDNDIGAGKSNDQVWEDYQAFVAAVQDASPSTQIAFLTIKPSLSRWALWPQMDGFNERVREQAASHPGLHYIDTATPMLGEDGEPMPHFFVADGLHMTSAGYDLWTQVTKESLARIR